MSRELKSIETAGAALATRYAAFSRYSMEALEASFRLALGHLPTCAPVTLDIGAGTGVPARVLSRLLPGVRLIAIDRSAAMVEVCRESGIYEECVCADVAALPVADGAVDFAFSAQAFHLFEDKRAALAEIARTVGENGVILITTDTRENLRRQLFQRLLPRFSALDIPRHFDEQEVLDWAEHAQLALVGTAETEYCIEFPSLRGLVAFLESRPFFSMQQMSEEDFALDIAELRRGTADTSSEGPVLSHSAITGFLLARAPR